MTRLREALSGIAEEAPSADLADRAIAGHRRRRRATVTLAAVATVVVLAGVTATVLVAAPRRAEPVTPQHPRAVPVLPAGKVGAISHAYQPDCEKGDKGPGCVEREWRVVTRDGTTYRVPQALGETAAHWSAPVAISRDGRMLAYYGKDAGAHVVRDLLTGAETVSPVKVPERRIGTGSMLVVSDDGRYVVFDPREGTKDPGLLIDLKTGRTVSVPGVYEPVSVKDGVAELVRYVKTDLLLMPVTGGGRPVRFDGAFIMFSELAPDGRTVTAFKFPDHQKNRLSLLDARTGRLLREVPVKGLPKNAGITGATIWRSPSEVTLLVQDRQGGHAYAVDVRTGRARHTADYPGRKVLGLALPGAAGL